MLGSLKGGSLTVLATIPFEKKCLIITYFQQLLILFYQLCPARFHLGGPQHHNPRDREPFAHS